MRYMYSKKSTILYYPTIKIKDGVWLRNALLYWDKVSSIVPGSTYNDENSPEVEYLLRVGLYEPLYATEMQEDRELCEEFCKAVKKNINFYKKPKSNNTDNKSVSREYMIHIDKTPNSILDYLLDEGIAKRNCDGLWLNMNELDANIYMATLARYLAKIYGNVEIATDDRTKFLYPFLPEKSKKKGNIQPFLDIAMQGILPVPNMECSLEDIIDFKKQYNKELMCFRKRISKIQESLNECKNIKELEEKIYAFQQEIEGDLNEIDNLMSERGMKKTKKALRTLIPMGVETCTAILKSKGKMSSMQAIVANQMVKFGMKLFSTEQELKLDEEKAYLFYARENGLVHRHRNW